MFESLRCGLFSAFRSLLLTDANIIRLDTSWVLFRSRAVGVFGTWLLTDRYAVPLMPRLAKRLMRFNNLTFVLLFRSQPWGRSNFGACHRTFECTLGPDYTAVVDALKGPLVFSFSLLPSSSSPWVNLDIYRVVCCSAVAVCPGPISSCLTQLEWSAVWVASGQTNKWKRFAGTLRWRLQKRLKRWQ